MSKQDLLQNLSAERDALAEFEAIYQAEDNLDHLVYPLWTVRDLLAHMVFWQEAFARNVEAMAHERKPEPLKGRMKELNEQSVLDMSSIHTLLEKLDQAQQIIEQFVGQLPSDAQIPYRKGAQSYTPSRHVAVAAEHFRYHIKHIKKALETDVVQSA